MKTVTKMLLLDKHKELAIDTNDYVLVEDLGDFTGLPLFALEGNEYVEVGTVPAIAINEETEVLTVGDHVSYFDDFDFDFELQEGELVPTAVYVLGIDPKAAELAPEEPEQEPEPEPEPEPDLEEP